VAPWLVSATGLVIFSSFITTIIVAEVNRTLPDNEQVNYFFWYAREILESHTSA